MKQCLSKWFSSRRTIFRLVVVAGLVSICACGYRFAGGEPLPGGVTSVGIEKIENRTSESGIENMLVNHLIAEFTRNGKKLSPSTQNADGILSGVIESVQIDSVSHKNIHSALERRVRLRLSLKLTDVGGNVLWSIDGMSASRVFDVHAEKLRTERKRRDALSELLEKMSENIYSRLTAGF